MIFRAYNQNIESDFDLQLPKTTEKPTIRFLEKEIRINKTFQTNVYRKGIKAKVEIREKSIILDWKNVARFEIFDEQTIYYQRFTGDDGVFRLFALSEALGSILYQKGFFLLHGSAVKIGEKATIFIGKAGAGKSTTVAAFAKENFTVLCDDLTAISFDENQDPVILPAFPQIKIWEDSVKNLGFDQTKLEPAFEGHNKFLLSQSEENFPQKPIELEQIIILEKPFSSKKKEINATEIPIELLKYFPLPHQLLKGEYLKKHFVDSLKIISKVQISKINRPKNFQKLYDFVNNFR